MSIAFIPERNTKSDTKICAWADCDNEFQTQYSHQRFCCKACNNLYQRRLAKERREAEKAAQPPTKKELGAQENRNYKANRELNFTWLTRSL